MWKVTGTIQLFLEGRDLRVVDDLAEDEDMRGFGAAGLESPDGSSTTAQRTQQIDGIPSRIRSQFFPSSREAKSRPLRVPKYIPAGSNESVVMASRKTVSYARFCGRPRMSGSHESPALRVR